CCGRRGRIRAPLNDGPHRPRSLHPVRLAPRRRRRRSLRDPCAARAGGPRVAVLPLRVPTPAPNPDLPSEAPPCEPRRLLLLLAGAAALVLGLLAVHARTVAADPYGYTL